MWFVVDAALGLAVDERLTELTLGEARAPAKNQGCF